MTSKKLSQGADDAPPEERATIDFLRVHPEFLMRHPELLAGLALRHPESGSAVSLIERQVQVLRERNEALDAQLRSLLAIARDNDVLADRLHEFALAMIDAPGVDEALATAQDMLRQQFQLDGVAVLLTDPAHRGHAGHVEPDGGPVDTLLRELNKRRLLVGGALDSATLAALFGGAADRIRSTALVALGHKPVRGILCLGSHDPQHFRPDMATHFLARLGELVVATLARTPR